MFETPFLGFFSDKNQLVHLSPMFLRVEVDLSQLIQVDEALQILETDENSGHYVIASSRPPERRPLECRTHVPKDNV